MVNKNKSKKSLLDEITRLKKDLKKKKKYGLVWEEKPEEVVEMCKEKLPVLKEVKSKEIMTDKDKPVNLLIEGDNYHALSVLNYTHAKKIDVIYIDPPYNTGNKDFIYNDQYVDREDSYRHSKWLSFMEKRLKLAKNLLKDTGVIFISIDDNEVAQLKLLCDKIFEEKNFVTAITVQVNKGGRDYLPIAVTHEYILCYFKSGKGDLNELLKTVEFELEDSSGKYELRELRNRNPKFTRKNRPNLFYPIYINSKSEDKTGQCLISLEKSRNFNVEVFPLNSKGEDGCWRWGKSLVSQNIKDRTNLSNVVGKQRRDGGWNVYEKSRKTTTKAKSIWEDTEVRTEQGTIDLRELGMANMFDHPKSVFLIKKTVRLATKKDATVLDFFSGSGTTGQAVLELNQEDGGNRTFILCTNNELNGFEKELKEKGLNGKDIEKYGICQRVTYPRLEKVINGYKSNRNGEKVDGLVENLKYFKTDFVDADPSDSNKIKLTKQAAEMLCIKEGTFELVRDGEDVKIFKNSKHYTGIIFNQAAIPAFKKAIKDLNGKFSVYVFSLGDEAFDDEFADMKQKINIVTIPEAILKVYRRIFK